VDLRDVRTHGSVSTRLADAFLRAAIRSPANSVVPAAYACAVGWSAISGVCAAGVSRLPRRKRLTLLLLPPPFATPAKPLATVAYAAHSMPERISQSGAADCDRERIARV